MSDSQRKIFAEQCQTIWEQIGGNKLKVMTGAKDLCFSSENPMPNIMFRLPRYGHTPINHVKVVLNGMDLYDVTFSKFHKVKGVYKLDVVKSLSDIYAEDLRGTFERETGLATRL